MKINVLGFGVMGRQIAALFYTGGFDVCIWNRSPVPELEFRRTLRRIRGFFPEGPAGKISFTTDLNMLTDAITIETIVEELDSKRHLYERASKIISRGFYTNTSCLGPDEIGQNVGVMHFFNPIQLKTMEYTPVELPDMTGIQKVLEFLSGVGFVIGNVKKNNGYIINYLLLREVSSTLKLVEQYGYSVDSINRVYEKINNGKNIFKIIDISGIDTMEKGMRILNQRDKSIYLPKCFKTALDRNILGRKNKTSIVQVLI